MSKGWTEDQGKSPVEEHRYGTGQGGEDGGAPGEMPSNEDEKRLFYRDERPRLPLQLARELYPDRRMIAGLLPATDVGVDPGAG